MRKLTTIFDFLKNTNKLKAITNILFFENH